ncbi:hypothetical protein [Terrihalobacillus insolitus]|uniref:hypothetical protein n=1 Tax=Terrihalobacillus insolitus TaxID=2950438 RepID=UPI00234125BB|nr:hypothetical protein [Terrihalobacillus insolitus]MDC3411980.1 DUF2092 domain-containing protein [Terrihalobacillus insolitus]
MKLLKKLFLGVVVGGLFLSVGISPAFAAYPTYAGLSPVNETQIGSSAYFTKKLSWGGGTTNTYYVSYYNGKTTSYYDPEANYYSSTDTSYYSKGSLSTKTWNTSLYVSNGGSDTAYGSVTLSDR